MSLLYCFVLVCLSFFAVCLHPLSVIISVYRCFPVIYFFTFIAIRTNDAIIFCVAFKSFLPHVCLCSLFNFATSWEISSRWHSQQEALNVNVKKTFTGSRQVYLTISVEIMLKSTWKINLNTTISTKKYRYGACDCVFCPRRRHIIHNSFQSAIFWFVRFLINWPHLCWIHILSFLYVYVYFFILFFFFVWQPKKLE